MWCFICTSYLEDDDEERDEEGSHKQRDHLGLISKEYAEPFGRNYFGGPQQAHKYQHR